MADESEKKSSGAGEELDGDWDKKEDTAPGGPKAKRSSTSGADAEESDAAEAKGRAKVEPADDREDEEEDEEEDEDDEDDEDDEEDDDDEARDSTDDGSSGPARRSAPPEASDDWIPDWTPWAVLIGILAVGVAGGLGAFTTKQSATETAADTAGSATPTTTTTATAAATAPGAQMNAAQAGMIEARHLLVMYKGSMRAPDSITRTKDEAKRRAQEALAKIKAGQPFEKVVGDYSDEPGAAARGGKLGKFRREQMVKPFSDAAFALKPGEVSGVVETNFGFHVIQRTQ